VTGWRVATGVHGADRLPRRRARQRLVPTRVGRSIPGVAPACTDRRCVNPRVVGVRRCLTRRPARAGNPVVRRWARWRVGRRGGRCMLPGLPRPWRGGRGSASPLHAVVARHRCNLCVRWWRIPPPSGRGQAVPDPPAREGRGMAPSPGYGWKSRREWAPAVRPGLQPRAESPSPLKGAGPAEAARPGWGARW
jgi:hypothetical protein